MSLFFPLEQSRPLALNNVGEIVTMVNISEIKAQVALLQRVEGYKSSESKRRWWIIDDESYEAKRRHLRNCMAILDQVGVNKSEAMKALGPRKWITAITDITNSDGVKYFVKGMFNNCMFVSIRREADGMKEWQEPKLGLLVQKNEQISGYPANDGKQINILTGQCKTKIL